MTGWNDRHRMTRKEKAEASNAARREDLHFLADNGETREAAAQRLGITLITLDRWCCRHDREVWRKLGSNEERPGRTREGHTNWRAVA